jgi:hypothetical protein
MLPILNFSGAKKSRPFGRTLKNEIRLWSSGTNTGVCAVEKQSHNKENGHPSSCSDKPQREDTLSPPGSPGNGGAAIRKTIRDPTVWIERLLAAHRRDLS